VNYRRLNIALIMAVVAVILQTTLFVELRPFGVAPDFVLLVVVVCALYLSDEGVMVLAFSAGLLNDLLGNTLLGVWALVLTVVAFAAARARYRVEGSVPAMAVGVLVITIAGELLFAIVGTLFGQEVFADTAVFKKIVLAGVYNLALAPGVVVLAARVLQGRARPNEGVWA
jgi:rod shape-determining protein MreD